MRGDGVVGGLRHDRIGVWQASKSNLEVKLLTVIVLYFSHIFHHF